MQGNKNSKGEGKVNKAQESGQVCRKLSGQTGG